jgi:hypothetical protein
VKPREIAVEFDGFRRFVYVKAVETFVFGYALLTCPLGA